MRLLPNGKSVYHYWLARVVTNPSVPYITLYYILAEPQIDMEACPFSGAQKRMENEDLLGQCHGVFKSVMGLN